MTLCFHLSVIKVFHCIFQLTTFWLCDIFIGFMWRWWSMNWFRLGSDFWRGWWKTRKLPSDSCAGRNEFGIHCSLSENTAPKFILTCIQNKDTEPLPCVCQCICSYTNTLLLFYSTGSCVWYISNSKWITKPKVYRCKSIIPPGKHTEF
jgi:hypothetical protein